MLTGREAVARAGIDAVALKPAECDVSRAANSPIDRVTIDYEGREHLPDAETLDRLAAEAELYVTTPVRADGFDPLGDDSLIDKIPDPPPAGCSWRATARTSRRTSRRRAVAPRLGAARAARRPRRVGRHGASSASRWRRGGTQFELLSLSVDRSRRAWAPRRRVRRRIAVYAPTVLTDDEDVVLDAVGASSPAPPPAGPRAPGRGRRWKRRRPRHRPAHGRLGDGAHPRGALGGRSGTSRSSGRQRRSASESMRFGRPVSTTWSATRPRDRRVPVSGRPRRAHPRRF